jgi:hypothetical protein
MCSHKYKYFLVIKNEFENKKNVVRTPAAGEMKVVRQRQG